MRRRIPIHLAAGLTLTMIEPSVEQVIRLLDLEALDDPEAAEAGLRALLGECVELAPAEDLATLDEAALAALMTAFFATLEHDGPRRPVQPGAEPVPSSLERALASLSARGCHQPWAWGWRHFLLVTEALTEDAPHE